MSCNGKTINLESLVALVTFEHHTQHMFIFRKNATCIQKIPQPIRPKDYKWKNYRMNESNAISFLYQKKISRSFFSGGLLSDILNALLM